MQGSLLLAMLAIEGGSLLVSYGAKMVLPELSKVLSNQEINDLDKAISSSKIRDGVLEAYRKIRIRCR